MQKTIKTKHLYINVEEMKNRHRGDGGSGGGGGGEEEGETYAAWLPAPRDEIGA